MSKQTPGQRRNASRKPNVNAAPTSAESVPARGSFFSQIPLDVRAFAVWWLACCMLFIAANPTQIFDPIAVIPLPDNSVMAGADAWNPWLSTFDSLRSLFIWPTWLASVIAALLIATLGQRMVQRGEGVAAIAMVAGLCLIDPYDGLLAGWIVYAAVRLRDRMLAEPPLSHAMFFAIVGALSAAALASSLEATIPLSVLAVVVGTLILQSIRERRQTALVATLAAVLGLVASGLIAWQHGLLAALLRPITAILNRPPATLLPSLSVPWQAPDFGWAHGLALLFILACWWRWVVARSPRMADGAMLAVFTALAIGSARYSWLATVAIACIASSQNFAASQPPSPTVARRWRRAACLVALLVLIAQVGLQRYDVLSALSSRRQIDPQQWNLAGPAVLQNLDRAANWQLQDDRGVHPLVVSDRWDVYGDFYPQYAMIVNDWSSWREHRYVRSDGQWGGFGEWFDQWNPKLVVIEAADLATIRQHSLDSPWKTLGIDSRRVIFAQIDDRDASGPLRESAQLLSILEIPRPAPNVDFEHAIAFGGPTDARRIALVLSALRFPYAALRVLPNDNHLSTEFSRTMALLESAHRTLRFTGTPSLIDQSRALAHSERLLGRRDLTNQQRNQLQRAIDALQDVRQSSSLIVDVPAENDPALQSLEETAREQLMRGDFGAARQTTAKLGNNNTSLLLTTAATLSMSPPESILAALQSADSDHDSGSSDGLAELLFYRGSLRLETGDFRGALQDFTRSLNSTPSPPQRDLISAFCSQIAN
ncbi:hypothetical protein [Rosistilla oblonga]|uniref:hypothetical protein n=1 Tax=Rosistilla oblonga TaxID=2527990 RepID=UPI003A9714CC